MASTRPSRRCIAVVATLVVLAAAAHAGPVSATSSPIFGGQFDTIPITVNGSYTPLPLHCFESYFDVLWYGRGSAPDSRWLDVDLAATPAVTSTKVPATVSGDYRPFVGDFDGDNCDDIFWYAPGTAQDYVTYPVGGSTVPTSTDRVTINGTYAPISLGGRVILSGPDGSFALDTAPGSLNGTFVPGTTASVGAFGILHAPGPAQDYVIAS